MVSIGLATKKNKCENTIEDIVHSASSYKAKGRESKRNFMPLEDPVK